MMLSSTFRFVSNCCGMPDKLFRNDAYWDLMNNQFVISFVDISTSSGAIGTGYSGGAAFADVDAGVRARARACVCVHARARMGVWAYVSA